MMVGCLLMNSSIATIDFMCVCVYMYILCSHVCLLSFTQGSVNHNVQLPTSIIEFFNFVSRHFNPVIDKSNLIV